MHLPDGRAQSGSPESRYDQRFGIFGRLGGGYRGLFKKLISKSKVRVSRKV
jgi:hypothetical protein